MLLFILRPAIVPSPAATLTSRMDELQFLEVSAVPHLQWFVCSIQLRYCRQQLPGWRTKNKLQVYRFWQVATNSYGKMCLFLVLSQVMIRRQSKINRTRSEIKCIPVRKYFENIIYSLKTPRTFYPSSTSCAGPSLWLIPLGSPNQRRELLWTHHQNQSVE